MKNVLAFLAVLGLALPSQSFALVGGPFDNNTPTGLYGGTFEAIYKFKNGNGIVRFTQAGNGQLNVYSFSLIFYKGIIYQGNAVGSVNPKEGYATGMSSSVTTGTEGEGEAAISFASGTARNIGICNANWFGKVEENGYHVRFSGKGVAHFFGQLDQEIEAESVIDSVVDTTTVDSDTFSLPDLNPDTEEITVDTPLGPAIFLNPGIEPGTTGTFTVDVSGTTLADTIDTFTIDDFVGEDGTQPFLPVVPGGQFLLLDLTALGGYTNADFADPDGFQQDPGPGDIVEWDGPNQRWVIVYDASAASAPLVSVIQGADTWLLNGLSFGEPALALEADFNVTIEESSSASWFQEGTIVTAQRNETETQSEVSEEGLLSTLGEQKDFDHVGHRVKIKVYGSKVSYFIPGSTGETFTPLVPLTESENAPVEITGTQLLFEDE